MSSNLSENIKDAPKNQSIRSFNAWLDSAVVLQWLQDKAEHKVVVSNWVVKTRQKNYIKLSYLQIKSYLVDLGSKGC